MREGGSSAPSPFAFVSSGTYGNTVKVPALVAVPCDVVTAILPVFAPVGTVAVICEGEFTVYAVALTPPKVTLDAPVRPPPVMTTVRSEERRVGKEC